MSYSLNTTKNARQLLADYQVRSSFFLSTPYRTLLAKGNIATVIQDDEHTELGHVSNRVATTLNHIKQATQAEPIVVGAIPFYPKEAARLFVPETIEWADALQFSSADQVKRSISNYTIRSVPDLSDFINHVKQGIERIRANELHKIVLARTLEVSCTSKVDIEQLLFNLAICNKSGYTFAVDLTGQHEHGFSHQAYHKTLLGASPELLVSKQGHLVFSNPLAGSIPRSKDPMEDQRRAAQLLSSAKDRHEHAFVVEAVVNALQPFCKKIDFPDAPSLINTSTMWHLSSEIKGELLDPAISSLDLAASLHPTPAVCGTPTAVARAAIQEIEPFNRDFYTGMVGWCDATGDGEWIIALRCAEVEEHNIRLFAGVGIVEQSDPEAELAETSAKFRTMLQALAIDAESAITND